MKLTDDELKQLRDNKGKIISMKGFLKASTNQTVFTEQTDHIPVLFEIECNMKEVTDSIIFAHITQSNESILFDFNATFILGDIQEEEHVWLVKMIAVNDGRIIKDRYINDVRHQYEDLSIPIIFGKLICNMSQWNQSQTYFEHLLNDPHDEDLAWIEHSLGQAHHWKGEWNEARFYYDLSYDRMIKTEPARIKDSSIVLSDIGELLYLEGNTEEAYEFHQKALILRKNYYSSYHTYIATSLNNIGVIYLQRQKHEEALKLHNQALAIWEEYYNAFHIDITSCLTDIAEILIDQDKYDEAFDYLQRAMSIYEKYYPSSHVFMVGTMHIIGHILFRQEKYQEGLHLAQRALRIIKKVLPIWSY